jgi:hypothetical protein
MNFLEFRVFPLKWQDHRKPVASQRSVLTVLFGDCGIVYNYIISSSKSSLVSICRPEGHIWVVIAAKYIHIERKRLRLSFKDSSEMSIISAEL